MTFAHGPFLQLVVGGLIACSFFACSDGATDDEPLLTSERAEDRLDPIYGGVLDNGPAHEDVVALYGNGSLCSGTLIAPNVVITARHCVSKVNPQVTCQRDVISDHAASSIRVYRGVSGNNYVATGKAVFHDGSTSLCGHDVALLVLDRNVVGIAPRRVRVSKVPTVNELFLAVGYGKTQQGTSGTRYYRNNVRLTGTLASTGHRDFNGTNSICNGDSGGPAISSAGAVMGITSRTSSCSGNENKWTRTDIYKALLDQAVKYAGSYYVGEDGAVYNFSGASTPATPVGADGNVVKCASAPSSCGSIGSTPTQQWFGCCHNNSVYWCDSQNGGWTLRSQNCTPTGMGCGFASNYNSMYCVSPAK